MSRLSSECNLLPFHPMDSSGRNQPPHSSVDYERYQIPHLVSDFESCSFQLLSPANVLIPYPQVRLHNSSTSKAKDFCRSAGSAAPPAHVSSRGAFAEKWK